MSCNSAYSSLFVVCKTAEQRDELPARFQKEKPGQGAFIAEQLLSYEPLLRYHAILTTIFWSSIVGFTRISTSIWKVIGCWRLKVAIFDVKSRKEKFPMPR